ncbi:hypothetical protein BY458DRAFT_516462 [Sporodiniella umbellata]|nr:hypothetical protein BY458DRAFT_516462 [Sporodiniella umbellata]
MISGLAVESTNWVLNTSLEYIRMFVAQHQTTCCQSEDKNIRPTLKKRRLPPSSLFLNSLPYKSTLKTTYSVSVPGTPDPESFKYPMAM